MKKNIPHYDTLTDSKNLPHVSLIIPFHPEMTKKTGLLKLLASAADKAERDLLKKHSEEIATPVIKKLRCLIENVECSKNEKTLAIFVSPFHEKVYYFTPSNRALNYLPVLVQKKNN